MNITEIAALIDDVEKSAGHCTSCHEDQDGGYASYGECFVYGDTIEAGPIFKACCCDQSREFEDRLKAVHAPT